MTHASTRGIHWYGVLCKNPACGRFIPLGEYARSRAPEVQLQSGYPGDRLLKYRCPHCDRWEVYFDDEAVCSTGEDNYIPDVAAQRRRKESQALSAAAHRKLAL